MMNTMSLPERLHLVAAVSDLMLAGSVQVYRPETRAFDTVIHDKTRRMAA